MARARHVIAVPLDARENVLRQIVPESIIPAEVRSLFVAQW